MKRSILIFALVIVSLFSIQINAFTSEGKLYTLIFDQLAPGREAISFEEWIEE